MFYIVLCEILVRQIFNLTILEKFIKIYIGDKCMAKMTKKQKNNIKKFAYKNFFLVLFLILVLISFLVFAYFQGWLDRFLKPKDETHFKSEAGGYVTTVNSLQDLRVNFLDVGQGDCIIIELPDGKNMIIDSGQHSKAKNAIQTFATDRNITTFDYLLLTHADSDHVDNMSWVIDTYDIKYIFRPNNYSDNNISKDLPSDFNTKTDGGYVVTTKVYANFMVSAYAERCPVEIFNKDSDFTNKLIYGGNEYSYTFDFLTPIAERNLIAYSDPNNYSPIMMLTFMNKKVMFTGDAEVKMLTEYVETYGDINNVDVLKVGHHGSENATTSEFIRAIDPEYAVIQCGLGNKYKHPHQEALDRLTSYDSNMKIYRNDTNGKIVLSIGADDFAFSLENEDCSYNLTAGENMPSTLSFGRYLQNRQMLVA